MDIFIKLLHNCIFIKTRVLIWLETALMSLFFFYIDFIKNCRTAFSHPDPDTLGSTQTCWLKLSLIVRGHTNVQFFFPNLPLVSVLGFLNNITRTFPISYI